MSMYACGCKCICAEACVRSESSLACQSSASASFEAGSLVDGQLVHRFRNWYGRVTGMRHCA